MIGQNVLADLDFLKRSIQKSRLKRCLYVGYTGFGNLGDEALKEAIYELFAPYLVLTDSKGLMVRSLERKKTIRFDGLFVGGGTILLKSEHFFKRITEGEYRSKVVFGAGVANPNFWSKVPSSNFAQNIEGWIRELETFDYISVRGPISKQTLEENGLKKEIKIIGDPALYFLRDLKGPKKKKKRLGLNVGLSRIGTQNDILWGKKETEFLEEVVKLINDAVRSGWEVSLIPMTAEDHHLMEALLPLCENQDAVELHDNYSSVKCTLDDLEACDVMIGEKLHAVVLAYCANTPSVMLEYRPKCRDFMESILMADYCLRTDEFTAEKALGLATELYGDLEHHRQHAHQVIQDYKSTLIEEAEKVGRVVGS